jgi:outer membrane lipoprotein
MWVRLISLALLGFLYGCSTHPSIPEAERGLSPRDVAQKKFQQTGEIRQWGGIIVAVQNLRDVTELEILAYPLNEKGHPIPDKDSQGRFIARKAGYLESADFAVGRQVTANGLIVDVRSGEVGKATYRFPVMNCDELVLWPEPSETGAKPKFHFGFGTSSGGHSHGSIGIGIGF